MRSWAGSKEKQNSKGQQHQERHTHEYPELLGRGQGRDGRPWAPPRKSPGGMGMSDGRRNVSGTCRVISQ